MKTKLALTALVAVLALGFPAQASAGIVTFDNLATPNTGSGIADWGLVPTNYAGFVWTGWEVVRADGTAGSYQAVYGNSYGAPSLNNFAYNGGNGNFITTTTGSPFNFFGADLTSFVQNNTYQVFSSNTLTVNGYLGSTLLYTSGAVTLSPSSFQTLNVNFLGIDKLDFQSDAEGKYWGLDNFRVPDGGTTLALLGGALLGLGALRRKFRG